MPSTKITKDHEEIRRWAEERNAKPAHVATTESGDDIGILRLEFPGATASNDANLEEISWDQFFEKFDERGLALLYQEETAGGERSNFNKLVSADTAAEAEESGPSGTPAKSSAPRKSGRAKTTPAAGNRAIKKTATKYAGTPATKKTAPVKKKAAVKKASSSRVARFGGLQKKAAAKKIARPPVKKASKKAARPAAKKKAAKSTARSSSSSGRAAKKATVKRTAAKTSSGAKRTAAKKSAARKRR
jgi:hypothetical protein